MRRSGIYRIICEPTGKFYVGSAINFTARWSMHKHYLFRGKHHSIHMQRAWSKHGADAFRFEILERCDGEVLIEREQYYLDTLKPFGTRGFNISPTAGSTRGAKRTPEQVERMASFFRGKKLSAEHKAKISAAGQGRKHKPGSIEKLRKARIAKNWQRGRPMNERQRTALLHQKGDRHPWYGRSHSAESKRKNAISQTRSPFEQLTADGLVVAVWATARDAALALGLKWPDTITRAAASGLRKQAGGHFWRRVQDRAIVS